MLYTISDKIYYTKHRYTYLEPSIGYIKGSRYSIMIDTGNSKDQIENFLKDLEEANLPIPTYAILTHYHWDHSFGAYYINIPLITTDKTKEYLEEMNGWNWDENSVNTRVLQRIENRYSATVMGKIYPNYEGIKIKIPNITKQGDFSLNLGDTIVYFYRSDNSHSDDSLLVYVKEEKILFIGDSHIKDYRTKPMSFDKEKLRKYIDQIKEIDFKIAIPGHGNVIPKEDLIANLEEEYSII